MELFWYTYNVQTATAPHHKRVTAYADFNDYVRRHLDEHGALLEPGPLFQKLHQNGIAR